MDARRGLATVLRTCLWTKASPARRPSPPKARQWEGRALSERMRVCATRQSKPIVPHHRAFLTGRRPLSRAAVNGAPCAALPGRSCGQASVANRAAVFGVSQPVLRTRTYIGCPWLGFGCETDWAFDRGQWRQGTPLAVAHFHLASRLLLRPQRSVIKPKPLLSYTSR